MPRIAVLIPVHNDASGLAATVASLGAEPEPHDIVVVDDGSTAPIQASLAGVHLVVRVDRQVGVAGALNAGLSWILTQSYSFVARIDAGDLHCAGRFRDQAQLLDSNPNSVLVGGQAVFVHADGREAFDWRVPARDDQLRRRQHLRNCLIHPALMIRAEALRRAGTYRRDCPGAEDYDLALRLMAVGAVYNLPSVVVQTRLNPRGVSASSRRAQLRSMMRLQLQYFDWRLPESYIGLIWSGLRWVAPYSVSTRLKELVRR